MVMFLPRIAFRPSLGIRTFATSLVNYNKPKYDKYYKILKYIKPIDETIYKVGEEIPKGLRIPKYSFKTPKYKYETMFFKRQNHGLYGGLQRKRSKNCSESGNKSLRVHLPNIQKSKLWSEALNKQIQVRVSTKVLKIITKEGGLDNYLTKDSPGRIKTLGKLGWRLRYEVLVKQNETKVDDKLVYYTDEQGNNFTVGKNKLLKLLYPYVKNDSYYGITATEFQHSHKHLKYEQLAEKLKSYNHDLSEITK